MAKIKKGLRNLRDAKAVGNGLEVWHTELLISLSESAVRPERSKSIRCAGSSKVPWLIASITFLSR